jgi:hypothetical protein
VEGVAVGFKVPCSRLLSKSGFGVRRLAVFSFFRCFLIVEWAFGWGFWVYQVTCNYGKKGTGHFPSYMEHRDRCIDFFCQCL